MWPVVILNTKHQSENSVKTELPMKNKGIRGAVHSKIIPSPECKCTPDCTGPHVSGD